MTLFCIVWLDSYSDDFLFPATRNLMNDFWSTMEYSVWFSDIFNTLKINIFARWFFCCCSKPIKNIAFFTFREQFWKKKYFIFFKKYPFFIDWPSWIIANVRLKMSEFCTARVSPIGFEIQWAMPAQFRILPTAPCRSSVLVLECSSRWITRQNEYTLEHEEGKIICASGCSTMRRWSRPFPCVVIGCQPRSGYASLHICWSAHWHIFVC